MKRIIIVGVSLAMVLFMGACTSASTPDDPDSTSPASAEPTSPSPSSSDRVCRDPHITHGIELTPRVDQDKNGELSVYVDVKRVENDALEKYSVWLWVSYKEDHNDPEEEVAKLPQTSRCRFYQEGIGESKGCGSLAVSSQLPGFYYASAAVCRLGYNR